MRALITGASGLLGSYLIKTSIGDGVDRVLYTKRFDVLDVGEVYSNFIAFKPDVVIHCAGEARVDYAEVNPYEVRFTNIFGLANLLMASAEYKAHFVFISSNAVYSGERPPYAEDSLRQPINEYGMTKKNCEDLVFRYPHKLSIVRPILMYGVPNPGRRGNMVTRAIDDLKTHGFTQAVDDVVSQPLSAMDAAIAIWWIIEIQKTNSLTMNIGSKEPITLYEFVQDIAETWGYGRDKVMPIKSSDLKQFAPRPRDTSYELSKMEQFGFNPLPVKQGLARMRQEIESKNSAMSDMGLSA